MDKKTMHTIYGIAIGAGIGTTAVIILTKLYKNRLVRKIETKTDTDINTDNNTSGDEDAIETDNLIPEFIKYLVDNGVSAEEVASICETVTRIKIELPEQFESVKERMIKMMNSDFDIEESHNFDNENFRLMYSSIDPCQLFVSNGFKILALGSEYQESMMCLADAIADLQETNLDEAMQVIYELYHIFNDLDIDNITDMTFDEKFKSYVEKYVVYQSDEETDIIDEDTEIKS